MLPRNIANPSMPRRFRKVSEQDQHVPQQDLFSSVRIFQYTQHIVLVSTCLLTSLSVSGCDFWPPALHTQIEELRMKVIDATGELYRLNRDNTTLRELQMAMQREMKEKERENEDLKKQLAVLITQAERQTRETHTVSPSVSAPQGMIQKGSYVFLQASHPPMTRPRIATIQRLLRSHGLPIRVDSIYGQETAAAVRGFQRSHGLAVDGVVGPITERALRQYTNSSKLVKDRSDQFFPHMR